MPAKRSICPILWCLLVIALARPLLAVDVDTDGDGVTDAEEIAAGTDPANSQSVPWRSLGSWRFSAGTFVGDDGQQPTAQNNVSITSSGFVGPGVSLVSPGSASLKYRATELSGKPNIAAVRGSILFRIKPTWRTGPGPGTWVTVLQTTNFAVRIDPTGSTLCLVSGSGPSTVTNAQVSIDVGNFGTYWSYGLVTYSPEQTSLSFDAPSTVVTGPGIIPPANFNDPNNFIAIGSAADGTGAIKGYMDEVVAFNAPGSLGLNPVTVSAAASNNPAGINLLWSSATNAITEVRRRLVGATAWDNIRAAFGTNFFDSTALPGERYEYNVNTRIANVTTGLPEDVGGFIKASVNGTPLHNQGKIILLVDRTLTNALQNDLGGFITNLVGDGWQVLRADVPRHIDDFSSGPAFLTNYFTMTNVIRPFVQSNYALFGPQIKYILAIGHIPVAYTGTIADDGHNATDAFHGAHTGAWASDLFYGDVDGIWTDTLNVTNSSYLFNRNFPADGRLDQNFLPANANGDAKLEIAVARIDLSFLPSFPDSEVELLKKYFKKVADYRNGVRSFAADAMALEYLNTPSTMAYDLANEMLSKVSVLKQANVGDVFLDTRSFLFGVQSGPGFFDRLNDSYPNVEHTTAQIAGGQLSTNCAFYFLRGSYFPDWNTQDNVMRAPLGMTNGGLAVGGFLSLNKSWRMSGLGVGYGIGSDMADVANTWQIPGNAQSVRTIELLGDPTLRYPVLTPPSGLNWTVTNNAVTLKWVPAPGASAYYIYRSTNGALGTFSTLTAAPISGTNYTDSGVPAGNVVYMVRSSALSAAAGTFTNLSQGIFSRTITSADSSSCCVPDQTILEDDSLSPQQFSLGEAAFEGGLAIAAFSSNSSLLPGANLSLSGSGQTRSVTAVPVTNQFGSATVTITIQTALSQIVRTFTLTVQPVNDPPTFTKGTNVAVGQGSGAQSIAAWATAISPGPSNESAQQVSFAVTNDAPALFTSQPAIAANGTLTFTADPLQRGLAHVTLRALDDGGTANGGTNASASQTFTVTIGLPLDTDGDGLPDDFEQLFGFDPNSPGDGSGDWDGDGMTNAEELAAGTNPKDSRSVLRINAAGSLSPTFGISFNTVAGRAYTLQANDAFADAASWQTLATSILGTGGSMQQLDAGAGSSTRRIYRVISTGSGGEQLSTEPVGLCRLTLLGNSDTLLSLPFLRPAAELAAVTSVSGNSVQVRGPSNWQAGQWVYSAGTQTNTYFMLVRSGAAAGDFYTITGNTIDSLTLDLQGATLAELQPGDSIALVPYWTLGTVFHGGTGVIASPSPGNRQTEILFPNLAAVGINLSAAATYYFWNGAWRQVGLGGAVKNDDVITPDMYVIVRQNSVTNTTVTTEGAVLSGRMRLLTRRNASGRQDNILALPRPLGISLNDSGLISSGAFRSSPSPGNRVDELLVFDNSILGKNKSAAGTYYYWNGGWRKVGLGGADRGGDVAFAPGTGFIVRSSTGSTNALWSNDAPY